MMDAYLSGDVYLAFGKRSGLLPGDATKKSHEQEREALTQCVLGIGYGIKERALAMRINRPRIYAREMLIAHRKTFPVYHRWATENIERAVLGRLVNKPLESVFGWPVYLNEGFRNYDDENRRGYRTNSSMNFPMKSNGAEMLRLACIFGLEQNIEICASVHDAVLINATLDRLEGDAKRMQACMAKASRIVLDGFELRSDVKLVRYPDRFMDGRGRKMWDKVWRHIRAVEAEERIARWPVNQKSRLGSSCLYR